MGMTQLNILESPGFFIVLLLHGAISLLVFSSVIFSRNFLRSVLRAFTMPLLLWFPLNEIKTLMFAVFALILESTGNH